MVRVGEARIEVDGNGVFAVHVFEDCTVRGDTGYSGLLPIGLKPPDPPPREKRPATSGDDEIIPDCLSTANPRGPMTKQTKKISSLKSRAKSRPEATVPAKASRTKSGRNSPTVAELKAELADVRKQIAAELKKPRKTKT